MHIESNIDDQQIKRCFSDFSRLQEESGINIQITEFDMCLPESELFDESGNAISLDTREKEDKMKVIERIIQDSGVQLEGLSYWTATDTLSPDVQRTNTKTFIAKDFYEKFKSLKEENIELEELLKHPFLSKNQVEKFRRIYLQEGGQQILEEMIKSRQRDAISSRGSGLYSEITRERGIMLQDIGKVTTQSFSQNPGRAMETTKLFENEVKTQKKIKEGQTHEEG